MTNSRRTGTAPFPSRDNGWEAWCEGTSPTTPCPATAGRSGVSGPSSYGSGAERCVSAANDTSLDWRRMNRLASINE